MMKANKSSPSTGTTGTLYQQVERFVLESFGLEHHSLRHLQRTVEWLKKLNHDADQDLLIAALAHDIQRSEQSDPLVLKHKKLDTLDQNYLSYHQERGADIIGAFLQGCGASPETVARVEDLVRHHEVGGNPDRDLVKDADSLSFLETNIDYFIDQAVPLLGITAVREKFDWMYQRISSEKAKCLATPYYESALKRLANL